ncbi:MAG: ABC transporter permease [Planctomycetota bacterium]
MTWVALKMLTGDRNKFFGIVFGVMFASLLISHQLSIFVGIMDRTRSQIKDVLEADLWVMDPKVRYIDEVEPRPEMDLHRVRGVEGVSWAVRFYKGMVRARLDDGNFRQVVLLGIDDASFVGAPREMVQGSLADLRRPDAFIIDEAGYSYLWPGQPIELGKVVEMNDHRAILVGVCKASPPFQTLPIVFSRYSQAIRFAPPERNTMSFVLVKGKPGVDLGELSERISAQTSLAAYTQDAFSRKTIDFFIKYTGIPVNFGITVALGFIVGIAIAGQTFYLFTVENLRQFGALKAMGVSNGRLVAMILVQGFVVGILGYGIGMGLCAAFFESTKHQLHLAGFCLRWQIMVVTAISVLVIVGLSSLLSVRKVLVLEPAIVFRG